MSSHPPATPRKLTIIWLVLMVLGLATMLAGKVTATEPVGIKWMVILMTITWIKANLILRYYLELDAATGGWSKVFNSLISLIILVLLGLYIGPSLI